VQPPSSETRTARIMALGICTGLMGISAVIARQMGFRFRDSCIMGVRLRVLGVRRGIRVGIIPRFLCRFRMVCLLPRFKAFVEGVLLDEDLCRLT
jgi:hypothetical protein